MILVGTSGFSYKDWIGPVYPEELPRAEWLSFYARKFPTCELNFSFYTIPNARTLARMAEKVPPGFLFSLKAYRGITHEREEDLRPMIADFKGALQPLIEAEKFACVLVQFPYAFRATEENRDYLRRIREEFGDLPLVVEFRRREWVTEATFDLLRELQMGFCCVDQPRFRSLIPPIAVVTAPIAYVRFHGRNAEKWWNHQEAWERYDYRYTEEELQEWVPKIRRMDQEASLTLAYANNHWQGQAVSTAGMLQRLLEEAV